MQKKLLCALLFSTMLLTACGTKTTKTTIETNESVSYEETYSESEEDLPNENEPESSLYDNTSIESWSTESGYVISIVENENDIDATIHANITFYDDSASMISAAETYCWDCAANGKCVLWFDPPVDADYNIVDYSNFEITYTVEDAHKNYSYTNYASQILIESNISSSGGVVAKMTNQTGTKIDWIDAVCVYYSDGNAVGFSYEYTTDFEENINIEFSAPTDESYNTLSFDNYVIYINSTQVYEE